MIRNTIRWHFHSWHASGCPPSPGHFRTNVVGDAVAPRLPLWGAHLSVPRGRRTASPFKLPHCGAHLGRRGPLRVNRVTVAVRHSLPVYPDQRTSTDRPSWSVPCHERQGKETRQFTLRRATPYLFRVSALTSVDEYFGEVSRSTVARSMRAETRGSADSASIRAEANCTPPRFCAGLDPGRPT